MKDKTPSRLRLCVGLTEAQMMALLLPTEQSVIRLFLGLDDDIERSLEEVSSHLGADPERVKEVFLQAMKKLEAATQPPTPPPSDRPAQVAGLPRPPVFADCRIGTYECESAANDEDAPSDQT